MNAARIVVVGSNFAGLTAAVELKEELPDCEVVVISRSEDFLFMPSLIWLPFGLRTRADITFPLRPVLEKKGVVFHHAEVTALDLPGRQVISSHGAERYDFLVIATGPKLNYAAVKGLGPRGGHTQSIFSLEDAEQAGVAFGRFLEEPGPVVIGAVQGASCFGAAYEFLFNFSYQLRKRKLSVPLTYLTAEPFLAHFGIGGFGMGTKLTEMFFKKEHITGVVDSAVAEIEPGLIRLTSGQELPFRYAMLAPSFQGVDAVRACTDIVNAGGFVKVKDTYQTEVYPEVFAAGVAVALDPPAPTRVPCGVPKTGYLSEEMARVVSHNIAALVRGDGELRHRAAGEIDAKCVLDAGDSGMIMTSDHFLEPRDHAWLIPGPEAHWAKLAFEKYFLATRKRGHV